MNTDFHRSKKQSFPIVFHLCQSVAYSAMFLSFVHDIRGIRVIGGLTFGCGGAALGNPRFEVCN
jgi:hypothetical protein